MRKGLVFVLALTVAMTVFIGPAGAATTDEQDFKDARRAELLEKVESASSLTIEEAGDVLAARATGEDVADDTLLNAVKALRAMDDTAATQRALTGSFINGVLERKTRARIPALFADQTAYDAAVARGAFVPDSAKPAVVETIGLSAEGVTDNADLLAAMSGRPVSVFLDLGRALPLPQTVWSQDVWDTYGVALTTVYLLAAGSAPQTAPWILPSDFRLTALHTPTKVTGPVFEGNTNNGRVWMQLDIDVVAGAAFDLHGVTDDIVLQLPISIYIEVNWRCTFSFFGICFAWSFGFVFNTPQTIIARNARFVFAYPAAAGEFPTRATAMDIVQSVYDRLGVLNNQTARDQFMTDAVPGGPGVADLSTQAPRVNYFGVQQDPSLPNPAGLRVRPRVAGAPAAPATNAGVTAGFSASEVRAWQLNILIVRWHNIGTGTAPMGPTIPATFYYDVPGASDYFLGGRADAFGAVYYNDWDATGRLPV